MAKKDKKRREEAQAAAAGEGTSTEEGTPEAAEEAGAQPVAGAPPSVAEATKEAAQEEPKRVVLTVEARLSLLEEAFDELITKVTESLDEIKEEVKKAPAVKRGLFGGKRTRTPVKDTSTNVVYLSKSHCGQALADLVGTDALDHFAFYKLQAAFPERFVEASEAEAAKAKEYWEAKQAKEAPSAPATPATPATTDTEESA